MSENLNKVAEMLKENLELQEKLQAQVRQLAKEEKDADALEVLARAVKIVLDIDLSKEDVQAFEAKTRELTLEELEKVNGGGDFFDSLLLFGVNLYQEIISD